MTVDGQPWRSFSFNAAAGVLSISNLYDPAVPALTSPQPNSHVVCVALKGTGTCAKSAGLCRRTTVGGDCAVLAADAAGACCPVAEAPTYQAADGSVPLDRETSQAFNVTLQLNRKSATYTCAKLGASRADRRALFKRVAATYAAALVRAGGSSVGALAARRVSSSWADGGWGVGEWSGIGRCRVEWWGSGRRRWAGSEGQSTAAGLGQTEEVPGPVQATLLPGGFHWLSRAKLDGQHEARQLVDIAEAPPYPAHLLLPP